ncbi:MAG: M81 family metallopeptidase [Alphaproteobacteria bacterium]|nr:M81 family metallopeptidase [Alphaproteobacteria bacterium]
MPPAPRIAILGIHLEANSFAPVTVKEDFVRLCWRAGEELTIEARKPAPATPPEIPGFYQRMDETGAWTPVPILAIASPPGGPMEQGLLNDVLDEMRQRLAAALPVDGVYIPNHGACSATGDLDPDGTLYAMVREMVGPEVPVVGTLDLHCNISERQVEAANAMVIYRTNPHVDQRERAAEAADILRRLLAGERTAMAFIRLPLCAPSVTMLTAKGAGPYADLLDYGQTLLGGDVLNVSIAGGFVYSDLPKNGMAIIVTAGNGNLGAARQAAIAIARRAWGERTRYHRALMSIEDAVKLSQAVAADPARLPVIYSDAGDNPGGGGRGNTQWLLAALHEAGVPGVVLGVFIDPELAAECHQRGEGARFRAVFNRTESQFSKRFEADARIVKTSDGVGVGRRGSMKGRSFSLGPAALVELEGSGMKVVLGSLRRQLNEPMMLEMFGIDIGKARTVVVKSRGHFRAGFDEFFTPDRVFEVDTAGLTSPILSRFPFKGLPRPVYPMDEDAAWTEPAWAKGL